MIGISTLTYDLAGSFWIDARFKNAYEGGRRGSVTATLDGGVAAYDAGYSAADVTLIATLAHPPLWLLQGLRYVVAHYSQLIIGCEAGCFRVVPSYALGNDLLTLRFRIIEQYA
jgi:hypothetical protein